MRVLIVDDEIEICMRLKSELKKEAHQVEYSTSAAGVTERIRNAQGEGKPYKLLLLDLAMPKVGGLELLKEIREAGLDLDVIIITAYGDEDKATEAIRLGAIDYLRKPISLEELRTAIFRVRQKRAREEEKALEHRILVVDDEKDLCARIKRELEKEGYEVAVAYDGIEGLEYFKNNRVDIVLADIRMPRMNGLEMLEECRAINPDFVSIIVTGFGDHEEAITALRMGVFEYLRKPISLEELVNVVSKGIDLLALRRGLSARRRELEIETALKTQHAERIGREKKFTENIVATVPDSLLVLDKDLRIKSANRTFYETFQTEIEPKKVIGTRITDILGDEDGRLGTELTRLFGTEDMLENFELRYRSEKLGERIFNITAREMLVEEEEEEEEEEELVVLLDITERKRAEEALRESEARYRALFGGIGDGILLHDDGGLILDANEVTCARLGRALAELKGMNIRELVTEENATQVAKHIQKSMTEGSDSFERVFVNKSGKAVPCEVLEDTIEYAGQRVILSVARDITERKRAEEQIKASLKEKEILLKEVHHRVKNNLQVISSLLRLQSGYVKDKESLEMFRESCDRVRSMALIHEKLYQSEELSRVDFAKYIQDLTDHLFRSYGANSEAIRLKINVVDGLLGIDTAIPCGLIINELVSNSLRYAFPEGREGKICIDLRSDLPAAPSDTAAQRGNKFTLIVSDNGVGLPKDLDFRNTKSLGLELVNTLADQLRGTIELDRSGGTAFKIRFTC